MSDNVGLSTPRGSGTSGYVQRNRAFVRPRDNAYAVPSNPRDFLAQQQKEQLNGRPRQPDQGILEHDRKRAIEVRVFALRDELEEKGDLDEDAIDEQCDLLRKKLTEDSERNGGAAAGGGPQRFKAHQVHEQARAKQIESERLRRALGINKDYEEGGHWRRQDEKVALKRKKEEEEEKAAEAAGKRRRRYSSDDGRAIHDDDVTSRSDVSYDSYEEGEIGRPRGRRSSPPLESVERTDTAGRQEKSDHRGGRGRTRTAVDDRGIQRGKAGRDSRSPRSESGSRRSASRSRSPSRTRNRSRSRSGDRRRRRSLSDSRSPSRRRSRSRSESYDSR